MLSYRVPVVLVRESTTRSTSGVCEACVCGKPSASQNQWSAAANDGAAFLFNLEVGVVVGVCTCLTLFWAQRGLFREFVVEFRSLPEGFGLIRQPLRARAWYRDVLRSPNHGRYHLFTLQVQEILGGWDGRRASALQLQSAAQAEFPIVVGLFELDCCAIPLTAAGEGGGLFRSAYSTGYCEGRSRSASLSGGLSGTAHHTDSCEVLFNEIAADPESQLEIIWTAPVYSFAGSGGCRGRKMWRSQTPTHVRNLQTTDHLATYRMIEQKCHE